MQLRIKSGQLPTPAPLLLPGPVSRFSPTGSFGTVGGLTVPGVGSAPPVGNRSLFKSLSIVGLSWDCRQASRWEPAGTLAQSKPGGNFGGRTSCANATAGTATIKSGPKMYASFIARSFLAIERIS
jgi:hypothetical protein